MVKKQRDYKAEYARRVERAKEKYGESFDLSKARGHGSRREERQRQREHTSQRFTERTLSKLVDSMSVRHHALERVMNAQEAGLTVTEIRELIRLQNEAHELYIQGDLDGARGKQLDCAELAEILGVGDDEWHFYH